MMASALSGILSEKSQSISVRGHACVARSNIVHPLCHATLDVLNNVLIGCGWKQTPVKDGANKKAANS